MEWPWGIMKTNTNCGEKVKKQTKNKQAKTIQKTKQNRRKKKEKRKHTHTHTHTHPHTHKTSTKFTTTGCRNHSARRTNKQQEQNKNGL